MEGNNKNKQKPHAAIRWSPGLIIWLRVGEAKVPSMMSQRVGVKLTNF